MQADEFDVMGNAILKPCPFCGGQARYNIVPDMPHDGDPNGGGEYIDCSKCGCSTNLRFPLKEPVRNLLAETWNARVGREAAARSHTLALEALREIAKCGCDYWLATPCQDQGIAAKRFCPSCLARHALERIAKEESGG